MKITRKFVIGLALFATLSVSANETPNELPMAIKTSGAPSIDLVYEGHPVDRDQATDLAKNGVDLSTLNPLSSDPYTGAILPISNSDKFDYPPESSILHFLNDIEPNGMYRGQVEYGNRPFRLVVDMDNRQAIMNAAMLRALGYPVDMPKAYKELTLRFDTLAGLKTFVDNFAFETEFSRDRWLKKTDEKNLTITLQDVNLEYPRIDVQQLYNGKINTAWVAGHRAMRALIVPLMLLDVRLSENSVNIFPWEFTRIFAEHIMLSHGSVSAFKETTYEDARWAARKIALLTRPELKAIIDQAAYPADIGALLLEKITARRNQMVQVFNLAGELSASAVKLPYDVYLSTGKVIRGEATQEYYPNYAARFTVGDPASPLRWSELKHYVKMETLAQGIQALTQKINEQLQFKSAADGIADHKKDFLDAIAAHFKDHPNDPYVVPLKAWAEPLYGLSLNASRSLVTGTYYGSDSQAQLVDNFSVGASVGTFGGLDGRTYLQNFGLGANVSYQRTYTHVRPIASLKAVKGEKWKNLFVPGFLKSTSKVLTWKALNRKFTAFKGDYAQAQANYFTALGKDPKAQAPDMNALYKKDIGQDVPAGRQIPALSSDATSPAKFPDDLEDTVILGTLNAFLGDIRDNEVYTITDALVNQASAQVQVPLTTFAGMGLMDLVGKDLYNKISPAVGVSVTGQWAILKRLMFIRKGDQFTVYDSKMNTRSIGASMNFSAWIELAKIAANRKKGTADTDALMLDLSAATDEDKAKDETLAPDRKKLLMALAELMFKNEIETAEQIAPAYDIHHDMNGKTKSAKVLLWNWANYAETNKVTLTPPADPLHPFSVKEAMRTLYSARKMNLSGKNPYGIVGQVLSKAVGIAGLLDPGTNQNPSGTFLGSANWSQVRAESETTPSHEFRPMMTLEDYYSGWFLSKDKLLKILDAIQAKVNPLNLGSPIFRRDMFASTTQLQAYEIRSSILIYPSGVDKLEKILFGTKSRRELLLNMLDWVNPEDFRRRCRNYFEDQKIEPELEQLERVEDPNKVWNRCIQPWMRKVMRHIRKAPPRDQKEAYTEWLSTTFYLINAHLDLSRFLNRIGKENFFFQVRVSGFRKGDEGALNKNAETDYVTDTIGSVQSPISLGPFRDLKLYTNGVEWSVSDYELQGKFFGDGL